MCRQKNLRFSLFLEKSTKRGRRKQKGQKRKKPAFCILKEQKRYRIFLFLFLNKLKYIFCTLVKIKIIRNHTFLFKKIFFPSSSLFFFFFVVMLRENKKDCKRVGEKRKEELNREKNKTEF